MVGVCVGKEEVRGGGRQKAVSEEAVGRGGALLGNWNPAKACDGWLARNRNGRTGRFVVFSEVKGAVIHGWAELQVLLAGEVEVKLHRRC